MTQSRAGEQVYVEENDTPANPQLNQGSLLPGMNPLQLPTGSLSLNKQESRLEDEDLFAKEEDDDAGEIEENIVEKEEDDDDDVQILNKKTTSFQIQFTTATKIEEDDEKEENDDLLGKRVEESDEDEGLFVSYILPRFNNANLKLG